MNSSEEISPGAPAPRKRRRWRRVGIVLLAIAAVVWFIKSRPETPQQRIEREVKNILSPVRKNDPSGFNLQKVADTLDNWPQPFPKLGQLLGSRTDDDGSASSDIAGLGQPAVPMLTNLLVHDRSAAVRSTVARALGEMTDPRLTPHLMAAFTKERDPQVQSQIISSLGRTEDEKVVPFLISVLRGTNTPVKDDAVRALDNFQSPEALGIISNILVSASDTSLRRAAASTYRTEINPSIRNALRVALKSDSDLSVRQQAANVLAMDMGEETTTVLLAALEHTPDNSYESNSLLESVIEALRGRTNAIVQQALLDVLMMKKKWDKYPTNVRTKAVRNLTGFPGSETETNLQQVLNSESDPQVRAETARALGTLAAAQTNRHLLTVLTRCLETDNDPQVRAAAASALSEIGGEEVIKTLQTVLEKERKDEVRAEAIGGIFRRRNSETESLLLGLLDEPESGQQARAAIIRCLSSIRSQAAMPRLVVIATSSSEGDDVRLAAVQALSNFDNTNSAAALLQAMQKDASDSIRATAANMLGSLHSARTAPVISAFLTVLRSETNSIMRTDAAKSLGELRATNALDQLLQAMRYDQDYQVRANAAEALGKLGSLKPVPALEVAYRKDRNREVRSQALGSLAELAGTSLTQFFIKAFEDDPVMRTKLANILGRNGSPEAVAVLWKALQEDGWGDRRAAISALGDMGDARAVPTIINVLTNDGDGTTRVAAATALGQLGSSDAIPALETALEDRIQSVRQEAAWSLGHIGDARATAALSKLLNDRASEVRFAAAFALAEIGDRTAAPALEPLLQHSEDRTRLAAASALAFLDNPRGMSVLDATLRSQDTWQRFTALISLLRLNTPDARKLLTDCHDQDATLLVAIEAGLRVGGAGAATNMLRSARRSEAMTEDYRHFGARSLIFFNDPATLPVLEANANDSQDDVRAAVRIAIHRIKKKMADNEQAAAVK